MALISEQPRRPHQAHSHSDCEFHEKSETPSYAVDWFDTDYSGVLVCPDVLCAGQINPRLRQ
jgi:hypothetical protein